MGLEPLDAFQDMGAEAIRALDLWLDQTRRTVYLEGWLSGGSGAKVALVYIEERGADRKAVLKLCPAGDKTQDEYRKTKSAWQDAPPGFRRHLLAPLWEPIAVPVNDTCAGTPWFMFQRLAGGSTKNVTDFAQLPWDKRASAYKVVTRALLQKWGEADKKRGVTVQAFIKELLQDRLDDRQPLREWAARDARLFEEPTERLLLPHETEDLVNPFLLAKETRWGEMALRRTFFGRAHGDLNLGNILVPTGGGTKSFVLIDLARYSEAAPLARDPIQLLLHVVADRLAERGCGSAERSALLRVLSDSESSAGSLIRPELWAVICAHRQFVPDWAASLLDEWADNRILSLVACALMFCGRKGVSEENRMWFLRLAAHAATHYVEEWEGEGVKDPMEDPQAEPAPAVSTEAPDAGPGGEGVVVHVDFERRHETRHEAQLSVPLVGAVAQAAELVERLHADVEDLRMEVAGFGTSSHGQDLHIQATMARYLTDTAIEATHELVALRLQNSSTDYRGLIGYTEALGDLKRQVAVTRQEVHSLGVPAREPADLLRVRLTVEKLRQVTADLRGAVNRLR
ncbi:MULTISPECIES: phosphotransferase [unclassified Streptomyces]|uniref:phosphotransferase n=1 Tax=unclassified Streptomyces TaxID=2593676 RepID=UPI0036ECAAE4